MSDFDDVLGNIVSEINSPLNSEARRNIIENVLINSNLEETTASRMLTAFRNVGLGIATQDFYDLYRSVAGLNIQAGAIRNVLDDSIPREQTFAVARYKQPADYRYIISYNFYDENGELKNGGFSVDSNSIISKNQAIDEFNNAVGEYYPGREGQLEDVEVIKGYRRV